MAKLHRLTVACINEDTQHSVFNWVKEYWSKEVVESIFHDTEENEPDTQYYLTFVGTKRNLNNMRDDIFEVYGKEDIYDIYYT